jgi:hypothetical protein
MTDEEVADRMIARLNSMLEDEDVRKDVQALVETRIDVSQATADHATIQVTVSAGRPILGFLGLLNGLVGTVQQGKFAGWGLIAAEFTDADPSKLLRFVRTDQPKAEA